MAFWNKLNSFQQNIGNDYSATYTKNKNAFFYIGSYLLNSQTWKSIVLKPFLKTFDISMTFKLTDDIEKNKRIATTHKSFLSSNIEYSISIEVPSTSINEAILNAEKMDFLMGMMSPQHRQSGTSVTGQGVGSKSSELTFQSLFNDPCLKLSGKAKENCYAEQQRKLKKQNKKRETTGGQQVQIQTKKASNLQARQHMFYVSFANLIQSGKYTKKHTIDSGNDIRNYGLFCDINAIKIQPDLEMGFFEEDKKIYPKSYTVTFTMIPKDRLSENSSKVHIRGFSEGGKYAQIKNINNKSFTYDIKSWPFGVS